MRQQQRKINAAKRFLSSLAQDFIEEGRKRNNARKASAFLSSLAQDFIEESVRAHVPKNTV